MPEMIDEEGCVIAICDRNVCFRQGLIDITRIVPALAGRGLGCGQFSWRPDFRSHHMSMLK